MGAEHVSIDRLTWIRFWRALKNFATSEVGGKARALFAVLLILLLGINGLNVVNSYVGRYFMTAIEHRSMAEFLRQAITYVGVFAVCTIVSVTYRFTEERLALLWRELLTRRLVTFYLEHPIYHRLTDRLSENGEVANPDQRIADDVRAFTVTTLSFVLMLLNSIFTIVAFSGVLWSISPLLFGVAVAYAACGSLLTIALGRPLVSLNYRQLDKEANFRATLIHVRENAEPVALSRREEQLRNRALLRFDELAANLRRIIAVNRNLGFFTTGYNSLIQIIPALIVAPLFIRGQAEFGVITQSAMAFTHLLGAFSLIVTQFQSISSFAAVIARLDSLAEEVERARSATVSAIQVAESDEQLGYDKLTLRSPADGHVLLNELTLSVPRGTRLLVVGPNSAARAALFRATAGIWDSGEGRIIRPGADQIAFLAERPYLPPGTLRELLIATKQEPASSDEEILGVLHRLDIDAAAARVGGLDTERDWHNALSLTEQQLLNVARILLAAPRFAVLDRPSSTLSSAQVEQMLRLLRERSIACITFEETDARPSDYDAVLELTNDGRWTYDPTPGNEGFKNSD